MFLRKYISEFYFEQILDNYEEEYLKNMDENNFIKVYKIFKKYNFYFINDIILRYLEIFEMDYNEVEEGLNYLKNKLGENFVYIIGNDMKYLGILLKK